MATIPVSGVAATITAGSQVKTATSDANGSAKVTLALTQSQYNALAKITAVGTKDAYERGEANLTSLPTFAVAKESGINMSVAMQLYKNANFFMSQSHVMFDSRGGTILVPVSCPDNTWTVYSFDERLTVTKTNGAVSITCPAGSVEETFDPMSIRWNDPIGGWQYRSCSVSAAEDLQSVVFRGRVVDGATGVGVSGAAVVLGVYVPEPAIIWNEERVGFVDIAETRTDASGNYEIRQDFVAYLWDMLAPHGYTVRISAMDHNDASAVVASSALPAYPDENGVVVDFGTTYLVDTAASVFSVDLTDLQFDVAGSQMVTVTKAADDAFDFAFVEPAPWVNIVRSDINATQSRLYISVEPYDNEGIVPILGEGRKRAAQIVVYRTAAPSEGIAVTIHQASVDCGYYVSTTIKDSSTGAGIADAPCEAQVYSPITLSWESFSPKAVGVTDEAGAFTIRLSTADGKMNWAPLSGVRVISSPMGYVEGRVEVTNIDLPSNGGTGSLVLEDLLLTPAVPDEIPFAVDVTNVLLDSTGVAQVITVTKDADDGFDFEVDDPEASWLTVTRTDVSDTESKLTLTSTYHDNGGVIISPDLRRSTQLRIYKTNVDASFTDAITIPVVQGSSDYGLYVTGYVRGSDDNGLVYPIINAIVHVQYTRTISLKWLTLPAETLVTTDSSGRYRIRVSTVDEHFSKLFRYALRVIASKTGYNTVEGTLFTGGNDWAYGDTTKNFTSGDITLTEQPYDVPVTSQFYENEETE